MDTKTEVTSVDTKWVYFIFGVAVGAFVVPMVMRKKV